MFTIPPVFLSNHRVLFFVSAPDLLTFLSLPGFPRKDDVAVVEKPVLLLPFAFEIYRRIMNSFICLKVRIKAFKIRIQAFQIQMVRCGLVGCGTMGRGVVWWGVDGCGMVGVVWWVWYGGVW